MKFQFSPVQRPDSVSPDDWGDWKWQLRQFVSFEPPRPPLSGGRASAPLSGGREKTEKPNGKTESLSFINGTVPYYLKLIEERPESGLRKIIRPAWAEEAQNAGLPDPLAENAHSPVPGLVHRYPDRVLLFATDICAVYCRYCTRKHWTGKKQGFIRGGKLDAALNYIRGGKGIREVILSGGDPLTLSDRRIEDLLRRIREIDHIEIIRLASRLPVVCPMRLSPALLQIIRKFHPVFLLTHFNHPAELTAEAAAGLKAAADSGVPLFNQTVLLNGVNNHPALLQALSRRLLYLRVKPYYMFQCDPSLGTDHLRTTTENSQWIQRELWGRLSGLALPNLSLDIPGGGGKTGLTPDFLLRKEGPDRLVYRGWDGVKGVYINPPEGAVQEPPDRDRYMEEWRALKNQPYGGSKKRGFKKPTGQRRGRAFFGSEMQKTENLLKLFPESRLALSCQSGKTVLGRVLKRIAVFLEKEAEGGPLFVFAAGGAGAAARFAMDPADSLNRDNKKGGGIFPIIGSWDERALRLLHSLSGERLKRARFLFVSKSGRTAENRFYLEEIEKQFWENKQKPAQGQMELWTSEKGRRSFAARAVKKQNGAVFSPKDAEALPGRFSFLTESGLLQFGLFGGDPAALIAGFESAVQIKESNGKCTNTAAGTNRRSGARNPAGTDQRPAGPLDSDGGARGGGDTEAKTVLAFFLKFLETKGGRLFLLTDEGLAAIACWFESAWAESFTLSTHPVRACLVSDFLHGFAEETNEKTFVLSLKRRPARSVLGRMQAARETALRRFCKGQGAAFLPLNFFRGERSFVIGQILALLFQVTESAGRFLQADIYSQPKVDKLKKTVYNQIYEKR